MPKIDPMTGCTVMTLPEFWISEAEKEGAGRTAADLQQEFYEDMNAETLKEEARLKDPAVMLPMLQQAVRDWNAADPEAEQLPEPQSIIDYEYFNLIEGMRKSELDLAAYCKKPDGSEGKLLYTVTDWSGSMWDPPEHDENIRWVIK